MYRSLSLGACLILLFASVVTAQERAEERASIARTLQTLFARLEARDFDSIQAMCVPGSFGQSVRTSDQLKTLLADKRDVKVKQLQVKNVHFVEGIRGATGAIVTVALELEGTFAESGQPAFPDFPLDFDIRMQGRGGLWRIYSLPLDFDRQVIHLRIRTFYDAWAGKDVDAMMGVIATGAPGSAREAQDRQSMTKFVDDTGRFKIKEVSLEGLTIDGDKASAYVSIVQSVRKVAVDEYVDQAPLEFDWTVRRQGWDWKLASFEPHKQPGR